MSAEERNVVSGSFVEARRSALVSERMIESPSSPTRAKSLYDEQRTGKDPRVVTSDEVASQKPTYAGIQVNVSQRVMVLTLSLLLIAMACQREGSTQAPHRHPTSPNPSAEPPSCPLTKLPTFQMKP
jgi:hypothetical protein